MIEFDYYQSMFTLSILIIGLFLSFIIGCKKKVDISFVVALFLWHTFFSLFYYFFTLSNAADAVVYYYNSLGENLKFYPGSPFVYYFSSLFSKDLDANYLNVTFVYNLFGTLGLIFLYLSVKRYLEKTFVDLGLFIIYTLYEFLECWFR